MKPVSDLYGAHPGADIYVVGTGPSMRVFPPSFLEGRVTIGLNMAWKVAPLTYGITIGPHLNIPEMIGAEPRPEITWVTKRDKARAVLSPEHFDHADRNYYSFEIADRVPTSDDSVHDAGRVLDYVRKPTGNLLYQWSSISQTAANLAANMGASTVILVGCDNGALAGNHHGRAQHTKWSWKEPEERYAQYAEGLAEVRTALRDRGVSLLSLTPFLGLGDPEPDFLRLCAELGQPELEPPGPDISDVDGAGRGVVPMPRPPASPARVLLSRARSAARRLSR